MFAYHPKTTILSFPFSLSNFFIVHRDNVSEQEQILRQFDLASKYGPCLDMTRLERWERAFQLVPFKIS